MIALLGGTVGNFAPHQRAGFLRRISNLLGPEDRFLLGTDLVKDPAILEAAYNDSQGVTAEFNKNVLAVLNRELGADFDLGSFEHVARWDPENLWVDIRLRSLTNQVVNFDALDMLVPFGAGEEMRTEISTKFMRPGLEGIYAEAGLELTDWWTDREGLYALSLRAGLELELVALHRDRVPAPARGGVGRGHHEAALAVELGGDRQLAEGLEPDPPVALVLGEGEHLTEQPPSEPIAPDLGAEDDPADRRLAVALVAEAD